MSRALAVAFGLNAMGIAFESCASIPYFHEVSTRKRTAATLLAILLPRRRVDYTCRRPGSHHLAVRRLWTGTPGDKGGAAARLENEPPPHRPLKSLMHDPSFTITAVPGRSRCTA